MRIGRYEEWAAVKLPFSDIVLNVGHVAGDRATVANDNVLARDELLLLVKIRFQNRHIMLLSNSVEFHFSTGEGECQEK